MSLRVGRTLFVVFIGLFMGGIIAALGMAAVPVSWRGPWLPTAACVAGLLLTFLLARGATSEDASPTRRKLGR